MSRLGGRSQVHTLPCICSACTGKCMPDSCTLGYTPGSACRLQRSPKQPFARECSTNLMSRGEFKHANGSCNPQAPCDGVQSDPRGHIVDKPVPFAIHLPDPHFLPVFIGRDAESSVSTFTIWYAKGSSKVPKKVTKTREGDSEGGIAVTNIYVKISRKGVTFSPAMSCLLSSVQVIVRNPAFPLAPPRSAPVPSTS